MDITVIPCVGSLANAAAIIAGSLAGLAAAGRLPARVPEQLSRVLGAFTAILGVSMSMSGSFGLATLISLAAGTAIGTALDIHGACEHLAEWVKKKIHARDERFVDAFVTSSVLFVMGSMGILGSIEDGLGNFPSILFTKAIMDGVSSIVFASSMGMGVIFSSVPVLIYQAVITLCASTAQTLFTQDIIDALAAIGGVMLFALGLNLIGAAKIKTADQLPAILLAVLSAVFFGQ